MSVIPHLELIRALKKEWAIHPDSHASEEDLILLLAASINDLIRDDFPLLVSILYRLDIEEQKLKKLLNDHPDEDAGRLIAALIIERQKEKLVSRKKYKTPKPGDSDPEKW